MNIKQFSLFSIIRVVAQLVVFFALNLVVDMLFFSTLFTNNISGNGSSWVFFIFFLSTGLEDHSTQSAACKVFCPSSFLQYLIFVLTCVFE
jgi:hypothetical protein